MPGKPVRVSRKASVRVSGDGAPREAPSRGAVRLAAYAAPSDSPAIMDIPVDPVDSFADRATKAAHEAATQMGGRLPVAALREVVANLVHADFRDASIVVSAGGNEIAVTDRGPGVADKEKALLPGYTTATASLRGHIRGVGAGLALARDVLAAEGGSLSLDDNLGGGTVVKLTGPSASPAGKPQTEAIILPEREKKVLLLLGEEQEGGPSLVARGLDVSLSTAHRLLERLERLGLVVCGPKGKRKLSEYALANFERLVRAEG